MSTLPTPSITATAGLPSCPWWCTAAAEGHEWEPDHDGTWTRFHRRHVGGFTMSASEWATADGGSTIVMHPTLADFVLLDTAAHADELSEDLHQVAALLRLIESRATV